MTPFPNADRYFVEIAASLDPVADREASPLSPSLAPDASAASDSAAIAMLLRPDEHGALETLFIQRATVDGDPWSGHISFPGGRREPGDATLELTARRETLEEVGIALRVTDCLGALAPVRGRRRDIAHLAVHPFVYRYAGPRQTCVSHEAVAAVWVPLALLADSRQAVTHPCAVDGVERRFPGIRCGDAVIWGMTYRMLCDFFARTGVDLPEGES